MWAVKGVGYVASSLVSKISNMKLVKVSASMKAGRLAIRSHFLYTLFWTNHVDSGLAIWLPWRTGLYTAKRWIQQSLEPRSFDCSPPVKLILETTPCKEPLVRESLFKEMRGLVFWGCQGDFASLQTLIDLIPVLNYSSERLVCKQGGPHDGCWLCMILRVGSFFIPCPDGCARSTWLPALPSFREGH